MSIFFSKSISQLRENVAFLRAAQQLTAQNIAQSNTPNAVPKKLEKTRPFANYLTLSQPQGGIGFNGFQGSSASFKVSNDYENASEHTNGESRISLENESIRMAQIDDEHNLTVKMLSSWKKAVRTVTGNNGV